MKALNFLRKEIEECNQLLSEESVSENNMSKEDIDYMKTKILEYQEAIRELESFQKLKALDILQRVCDKNISIYDLGGEEIVATFAEVKDALSELKMTDNSIKCEDCFAYDKWKYQFKPKSCHECSMNYTCQYIKKG